MSSSSDGQRGAGGVVRPPENFISSVTINTNNKIFFKYNFRVSFPRRARCRWAENGTRSFPDICRCREQVQIVSMADVGTLRSIPPSSASANFFKSLSDQYLRCRLDIASHETFRTSSRRRHSSVRCSHFTPYYKNIPFKKFLAPLLISTGFFLTISETASPFAISKKKGPEVHDQLIRESILITNKIFNRLELFAPLFF